MAFNEEFRKEAHYLTISIKSPKPVKQSLELLIVDSKFAPYLAETRYIKPNDDAIKRQAKKWARESSNALATVADGARRTAMAARARGACSRRPRIPASARSQST
ncbi:MAG: hypothetical protein H8E66_33375 [Planctomycetes bacterium]|nr:hypothetical protein [Planctomycetota bacterium]